MPFILLFLLVRCSSFSTATFTPVIGILTQPFMTEVAMDVRSKNDLNNKGGEGHPTTKANHTMIAASYVKWIEAGGGRSIPIPYDATSTALLDDILSQVDGVLFPGGGLDDIPFSATHLWKALRGDRYHQNGADMVPLWGTCLGFEFIVRLASAQNSNSTNHTESDILEGGYDATNISLALLNVQRTGLYLPDSIYQSVVTKNITMNNHHLGVTPQRFLQNKNLVQLFDVTSTNIDQNGREFVSTIEPAVQGKRKNDNGNRRHLPPTPPPPIYGVQFHPEKNAFEYGLYPHTNIPYEAIDHSPEGIALSVYMARFFVGLARDNVLRKSRRSSTDSAASSSSSSTSKYNKVDRYPVVYSYPRQWGVKFEEFYIIPPASHWEKGEDLLLPPTSATTSTVESGGGSDYDHQQPQATNDETENAEHEPSLVRKRRSR
jgi:gamma-glutamyl hydrolase